jgi:hypothetical protein
MTGSDKLDLAVLLGSILLLGWGALWLVDVGTRWVDRREARADVEWRAGVSADTGVLLDSQRPDLGAGATVLPAARTSATPLYEAVTRKLGRPGSWGRTVPLGEPAAIVRPYSPSPDRPEVGQQVSDILSSEVSRDVRDLVRLGGATTAAALARHIDTVQARLYWRRLVDDWQADWQDFLSDVETGRYGAQMEGS